MQTMLMRTIVALAAILAFGTSNGWADAYKSRRHHHRAHIVQDEAALPPPYYGGTLVLHPASNIACNTPFRSTRALPCDQPVWVYGSPCEIDLGLGRYRSCY
jgi:hypothetical protein